MQFAKPSSSIRISVLRPGSAGIIRCAESQRQSTSISFMLKWPNTRHVSVTPPIALKLMLLLVLHNVRSQRELMATLPERLDGSWFLGLYLDSPKPGHSVLSKARARWGETLPPNTAGVCRNLYSVGLIADRAQAD
jgi:transposase